MKHIQIPKKLYDEIKEYCSYNDIKGVNHHIVFLIELGFNFMRYGTSPFDNNPPICIQHEEKEQIVEENTKNTEVQPIVEQINPIIEVKEKKVKKKGITVIKN